MHYSTGDYFPSRGELKSVTLPDGTAIEYAHAPLGRRIAKSVNGIIVEKYLWQGRTRLLAVYDGSDNLLMRFEYADARMPVAMTTNGSTYYLIYDQVGTLKGVTDTSGTIVKHIAYDTFGHILSDSNESFKVPFGFAGGLDDRDIGLVRFGYRDYNPETGRWTAKDPILFEGGDTDLYGYVLNDPVNFIDPMGLIDGMAQTHITMTGDIIIEYHESYYEQHPIIQMSVNVHENVHIKQLKQYAHELPWGFRYFSNLHYRNNKDKWEIEAYKKQIIFLEKQLERFKQKSPVWWIIKKEIIKAESYLHNHEQSLSIPGLCR